MNNLKRKIINIVQNINDMRLLKEIEMYILCVIRTMK